MAAAPTLRRAKSVDFLSERTYAYHQVVWDGGEVEPSAPARDGVGARAQGQRGGIKQPLQVGVDTTGTADAVKDTNSPRGLGQSEVALDPKAAFASSLEEINKPGRAAPPERVQRGSIPLLRMVEGLDDILLVRTQFLHQLDTLRGSRTYLETSLEHLSDRVDSVANPAPEPNVERLKDTSPYTERPIEASFGIAQNEPEVLIDPNIVIAAESSASKSLGQTAGPESSFSMVDTKFRQDLDRVRQGEKVFSAALESLSNMEYRLNERQKALVKDLRDPDRATLIVDQILAQHEVSLHATESPRAASDIPSLVDRYFDRRGDIGVLIERREELHEAWAQGMDEREFIAERGDDLEVSQEDFNANFEGRLEHIDRELQTAREEAYRLEQLCQQAGHNIERFRTRRSDTTSSLSKESVTPGSMIVDATPAIVADSQTLPDITRKPTKRINSWLENVPLSDTKGARGIFVSPSAPGSPQQAGADARQVLLPGSPFELQPEVVTSDGTLPQAPFPELSDHGDEPLTILPTTDLLAPGQRAPSTKHPSPLSAQEHNPGRSLLARFWRLAKQN